MKRGFRPCLLWRVGDINNTVIICYWLNVVFGEFYAFGTHILSSDDDRRTLYAARFL